MRVIVGALSCSCKYLCAFYPPPWLAEEEGCFMPSFTFCTNLTIFFVLLTIVRPNCVASPIERLKKNIAMNFGE